MFLLGVINKVISSHLRKKNNAWFSDEIREFPDCQELLTDIIKNTCSYGSWELIGDGIVDLALIILDINAGKYLTINHDCQETYLFIGKFSHITFQNFLI